jgi:ethanolamine utilization cobalamin adenosyltransferase
LYRFVRIESNRIRIRELDSFIPSYLAVQVEVTSEEQKRVEELDWFLGFEDALPKGKGEEVSLFVSALAAVAVQDK